MSSILFPRTESVPQLINQSVESSQNDCPVLAVKLRPLSLLIARVLSFKSDDVNLQLQQHRLSLFSVGEPLYLIAED